MKDKTLNNFFDMFMFSAVITPINANKHKIANFIAKQLDVSYIVADKVPNDVDADFLILYDNENADFSLLNKENILSMENPPKYICVIIGIGTNMQKLDELKKCPSIGLIYAEFAEINLEFNIKLLPMDDLNNNLVLTGHDVCSSKFCSHDQRSYSSNDHYLDKSLSVFHFTSDVSEKTILDILEYGGESKKDVYIYYNSRTESNLRKLDLKIKDDINFFNKLKLYSNTKIHDEDGILKIHN